MSNVFQQESPAKPLRRIVRPTPVARQRKATIGRIATNSQVMANSFGRSTSIRRSISSDSSVRFPMWLLPALPTRADDLDPYRDRDIIALRQSRMKNRVVRQVQPRGLPMAAHARGRSRSGIQTGPSSIARRLHPIRRQPSRNEAHIGPMSAPLVRVTNQPQRPTARPSRTRSTNSPTRNGSRTDRDGPTPLAPRFESVLVARSLLSSSPSLHNSHVEPQTSDATSAIHRLSLPRVSSRQSIDRSSIHRRAISTRQPAVISGHRIPLSMMYEPPRRLSMTSSTSTTPQASSLTRTSPRVSRRTAAQTTSSSSLTPTTPRSNSTATQPTTASRQVVNSRISPPVGPNWTSFPSRDSSPDVVSRKAESTPTIARIPASSPPSSTTTPSTTPSTTKPTTLSPTATTAPSQSPTSRFSSSSISPQTIADQASPRFPAASSSTINSVVSGNRVDTTAPAQVRRHVRSVIIPRSAGWRQVVGLPSEQKSITPSPVTTSTQDALFRRVAALANPYGAPLGTPGDIARRSPVSGSIFSLASSMNAAVRHNHESSESQISSPNESKRPLTRRAQRNRTETAQAQRTPTVSPDQTTSHKPATQVDRKITQKSREGQAITTSENRNTSRSANRNSGRSSTRNTSPSSSRRSAKSSQSAISRSATRGQRTSVQSRKIVNRDQVVSAASTATQRPSFVNLWSAVNHSIPRQSDLTARRSLRLPQPKAHSLDSKPGSIVRQQFALDAPLSHRSSGLSRRSIAHDLRSQKNNRTSQALRSASQGHPSTARVMTVARQTRSHMSTITPGASGGIQFAGSLAKAILRRQIHGDVDQAIAPNRAQRPRVSASASTTTSPSIHRSPSSTSTTGSRRTSDRETVPTPLTGAGANVAQNFLDRLSRTTGEDFTPAATLDQAQPSVTTVSRDMISRSPSREPQDADTVRPSASPIVRSDTSSHITTIDDEPHWAIMRRANVDDAAIDTGSPSTTRSSADPIERASRAMSETASVANGTVMRSVVAHSSQKPADGSSTRARSSKNSRQRSNPIVAPTSSAVLSSTPTSTSTSTSTSTKAPTPTSATLERQSSPKQSIDAARSRQEIVERGGSIASRGVLHRLVSRSVPTQRLSSPLNDLPVSPNVTPGMRIPSEALSAPPNTPTVVSTSPLVSSNNNEISRSVSSKSAALLPSPSVRREGRRSLKIQRQASGIQFAPSEDGTISADALVRMIESGQSLPNQVVHRQVSGTSSSGLIRAQRSPGHISRSGGSSIIQRSPSTTVKAAPGPVSILSQVLSPADDSESGSNQVTTSQLLDLMDWINRIVDDRLRQELERRGVAGGRW